jgi:hypothetical protein
LVPPLFVVSDAPFVRWINVQWLCAEEGYGAVPIPVPAHGPEPRTVMDLLILTKLPSPMVNVPAESMTTPPEEGLPGVAAVQLLIAAWMFAVSSRPLGLNVAQIVVRFGMPPTDWRPAIFQFADASRSDGSRPVVGSELLVPVVPVEASLSVHDAVLPPLPPAQVHDHGPLPLTFDAVPAVQRFVVGAVLTVDPFALPHAPFVSSRAVQLTVAPRPEPAQVQLQGPLPLTFDAVPALQRFVVGLLVRSAAFEEPQAPLTAPPVGVGPLGETVNVA